MGKVSDKKQKAKAIFLTGQYQQKEIAKIVGVSEITLSKWKQEDGWDDMRISLLTTRQNELKRLYKMLNVLNNSVDKKSEKEQPIDSKEADAVLKLTAAIKNLEIETSVADKVEVGCEFIDFVGKENSNLSKEITKWFDLFLNQ